MATAQITWPSTLPQFFESGSHTETLLPFTEISEDVYPPVVRQTRLGTKFAVTGSIHMTDVQYAQFVSWYVYTCRGMLLTFSATFVGPEAVYRFRSDFQASAKPGGGYIVTFDLLRDL